MRKLLISLGTLGLVLALFGALWGTALAQRPDGTEIMVPGEFAGKCEEGLDHVSFMFTNDLPPFLGDGANGFISCNPVSGPGNNGTFFNGTLELSGDDGSLVLDLSGLEAGDGCFGNFFGEGYIGDVAVSGEGSFTGTYDEVFNKTTLTFTGAYYPKRN